MRKILLSAALAAICAMGVTAMATETTALPDGKYVPGVNNYQSDGTADSKTIIIYKVNEADTITGDDIFYVDQADTETGTFGSNVTALMKANPTAGTYKVAVDSGKSTEFVISTGDEAVAGCIPTTRTSSEVLIEEYGDEYCSVAFTIEGITLDELGSFQTVKSLVRAAEGTTNSDWVIATSVGDVIEWNKDVTTLLPNTESTVKCAVQVDWVPVSQVERFELYFSADAA